MDAKEALIAEMLGDIGKLHDSVEQLKVDVPKFLIAVRKEQETLALTIDEAKKTVHETIAASLVKGMGDLDEYKKELLTGLAKALNQSSHDLVQGQIVQAGAKVDKKIEDVIKQRASAVNQILDKFNTELSLSIAEQHRATRRTTDALNQSLLKRFALPFFAALFGAVVGAGMVYLITPDYSPQQAQAQVQAQPQPQPEHHHKRN